MPKDIKASTLTKANALAQKLVKRAGEVLIQSKSKWKILDYKDAQDIVTDVDVAIEKEIINTIEKAFPDHSIFSEEIGAIDKKSPYTWVIDPLDGTKEYIRDIPLYCSAVMLEYLGEPLVSAIYDPELNQLFSASAGQGAYLNDRQIHVTPQTNLSKSMLFTYLPRQAKQVARLSPIFDIAYRVRGHANHNMSYCWVAKGGYEGHFSLFTPTHWWDVAPGILILKEAGGKITNALGEEINHQNYQSIVIATNGHIHQQLLTATENILLC